MTKPTETKACSACAKAKRRCGKQTPDCIRCKARGIQCAYPASKPSDFILLGISPTPSADPPAPALPPPTASSSAPPTSTSELDDSTDLSAIPLSLDLIGHHLSTSWFCALDTWIIKFPSCDPDNQISHSSGLRFISKIKAWLLTWIEKGCNPFIREQLYTNISPRWIQDAYSCLVIYVHKNQGNERWVCRILEDKMRSLVDEFETKQEDSEDAKKEKEDKKGKLNGLEHLARVQALLIYQMIGLYDGDIRVRYISEGHIPILTKWMREMVLFSGAQPSSTLSGTCLLPPQLSTTNSDPNLLWYTWILAESIRRTFILGSGIQVIFLGIKQGYTPPCDGGMMFTTRKGVWEAGSAGEWEGICMQLHTGLMQMADADRLFEEVRHEDINDFAKVVLDVTFGSERLERWGVSIEE